MTEAEIPLYPLRLGDVLSGQDWIEMGFHRVLGSRWRTVMGRNPEAGFYGFILWLESMRQNPAGTLPDHDDELAALAGLGLDVARWRDLRADALYGWRPCLVADADGGDGGVRLAHRTITGVALRSYGYKLRRGEKSADGTHGKRVQRILLKLPGTGLRRAGCTREFAEKVEAWLSARDLRITDPNVLSAVEDISKGNVAHINDFKRE